MPARATNSDQLVVDLQHADILCQELTTLRTVLDERGVQLPEAPAAPVTRDTALRLALVPLDYRIAADSAPGRAASPRDAARATIAETVRASFRRRFGWTPTFDFDHHLDHVQGSQHTVGPNRFVGDGEVTLAYWVVGGGSGVPEPAPRPARAVAACGVDERVRVGVLDTKLFPNSALFGSCLAEPSAILVRGDEPFPFLAGHATFVAGLIQRQAPDASIELHEVLDGMDAVATTWSVARAMAELADAGLDIVNLSLGCFTADDAAPLALTRAVELLTPQTVVVAAGGNYRGVVRPDGSRPAPRPFWPAAMDNVLAVGADDDTGAPAPFSADYPWVNVYAPGVQVTSTYLEGAVTSPPPPAGTSSADWPGPKQEFAGYARWSGTSFSAATVTGAIAARTIPGERTSREALRLLLTDDGQRDPQIRPAPSA